MIFRILKTFEDKFLLNRFINFNTMRFSEIPNKNKVSPKLILLDNNARNQLFEGIKEVAEVIKPTVGPKGKYSIIDQTLGDPLITRDGYTIAKQINLVNPIKGIGVRLAQDVASFCNDHTGDGTSTSIILFYELMKQGKKYIDTLIDPVTIKGNIEKMYPQISQYIHKNRIFPIDINQINRIAYHSSGRDKEISDLITLIVKNTSKEINIQVNIKRCLFRKKKRMK